VSGGTQSVYRFGGLLGLFELNMFGAVPISCTIDPPLACFSTSITVSEVGFCTDPEMLP
jgi:hypothetical protein